MAKFVFDFGNWEGKWFNPGEKRWGDFLHAIAALSEAEWQALTGKGRPPHGILKVNGLAYAVGDAAKRRTVKDRPKGAARYDELYYPPAACFAFAEGFKQNADITLHASHAPRDHKYAPDLIRSIKKTWLVECEYGTLTFNVRRVSTFDEPIGGLSHFIFSESGQERADNPLRDKTALLIDIGGYTSDYVAVDPRGNIDLLTIDSNILGTIRTIETFEKELRANNHVLFKDVGDLDTRRVERAIVTGCYEFGNAKLDCRDEAIAAINVLAGDVGQIIKRFGMANYDAVLLTGGGSVLVYDALVKAYPLMQFILVESNRELMKFANVFGGSKLASAMRR